MVAPDSVSTMLKVIVVADDGSDGPTMIFAPEIDMELATLSPDRDSELPEVVPEMAPITVPADVPAATVDGDTVKLLSVGDES